MLLLAAAVAAIPALSFTPQSGAVAQATATVRIVRPARIDFPGNGNHLGWLKDGGPRPRDTFVITPAGPTPARLIEFE